MSDFFYHLTVTLGRFPFLVSSTPTVLHPDRVPRTGPFILAANHFSPYDVPVLLRHTPRKLDFVSIVEVFRKPHVAWFFRNMNAFPMDRGRPDTRTTKIIVDRLHAGRCIALFPEGRIRPLPDSIVTPGNPLRPTLLRLARMAGVPVLPAVVTNTAPYKHWYNWLPTRQVHYGVAYGHPFPPPAEGGEPELEKTFQALHTEVHSAMTAKHLK